MNEVLRDICEIKWKIPPSLFYSLTLPGSGAAAHMLKMSQFGRAAGSKTLWRWEMLCRYDLKVNCEEYWRYSFMSHCNSKKEDQVCRWEMTLRSPACVSKQLSNWITRREFWRLTDPVHSQKRHCTVNCVVTLWQQAPWGLDPHLSALLSLPRSTVTAIKHGDTRLLIHSNREMAAFTCYMSD